MTHDILGDMRMNIEVGDRVDYHVVIGKEATTYDHEVERLGTLPNGEQVAWITDKRGCVAVDALSINHVKKDFYIGKNNNSTMTNTK